MIGKALPYLPLLFLLISPLPLCLAEDELQAKLNDQYAEAYRLKDARDFIAEVIAGIKKGTLLYIKTDSKEVRYVIVDRNKAIQSAAIATLEGKIGEDEAGRTIVSFEKNSESELGRLKKLLDKLDKKIKEKREKILALQEKIEKLREEERKREEEAKSEEGPGDEGAKTQSSPHEGDDIEKAPSPQSVYPGIYPGIPAQ